ncbi:MAG: hypothetical protein JSV34_00590 [Candidatus Omnitrophota bacterium]|nr:MAG: hypothetical protein JSV34_00590 [Candidatus Omnitrophota bacterium]
MCYLFNPTIKALGLLTVSFFLLFAVSNTKSNNLRKFGRVLAVALWIVAAYLIIIGTYSSLTGEDYLYKYKSKFYKGKKYYKDMPYHKGEEMPHHKGK